MAGNEGEQRAKLERAQQAIKQAQDLRRYHDSIGVSDSKLARIEVDAALRVAREAMHDAGLSTDES
jgi:hypothetical protein